MAKKIIVKLWKDGVGRGLVATSQVITIDGLGSGPVVAADFADNTLQGTVNTSAQRGGFYKELKSPSWSLSSLRSSYLAGNNIVLNWTTNLADVTPSINWYVVNVDQTVIYTGAGVASNRSVSPLLISGLTGTFNVATSPIDVNRDIQITIWDGEFGISSLLARSGTIKIIARELEVTLPATVPFRTVIPLTITGYPNEFVTYEGTSTSYAKGIRGNVTLNSSGSYFLADIRGGLEIAPGNFEYIFDGNITASPKTTRVTITQEGFYALQFVGNPPTQITEAGPLNIVLKGAPNETVTYSPLTSTAGGSSGTISLNSSGISTTVNLVSGLQLAPNKIYGWQFKGTISINPLSLNVAIVAGKQLNVSGTTPIAQNTAYSVTVSGKANDNITYTSEKQQIPIVYFDYYPEVESTYNQAHPNGDYNKQTFIDSWYSSTGSGLNYLSPTVINNDYNRTFTGSFTLTDVGNDDGQITYQIVDSAGLLGRRTPYLFKFYSSQLQQQKSLQVTVNKQYTLKVTGPSSVVSGKPIEITVYSVGSDNTVEVAGQNITGVKRLDTFPATGKFTFDLYTVVGTLAAGSYTYYFDSKRSDVINLANALNTPFTFSVTQDIPVTIIHTPLTGYGADTIPAGSFYEISIRSSVGDVVEITKETMPLANAYFDVYPEVRKAYLNQNQIREEASYATEHYNTIGSSEGRISPSEANSYRTNELEPKTKVTTISLPQVAGQNYGQTTVKFGPYPYPLVTPITLTLKGKNNNSIQKSFRVVSLGELKVQLPVSAQIDDVFCTITGVPNDTVVGVKIEASSSNNIPRPVEPRQERTFKLDSNGVYSGPFLSGGVGTTGTFNNLTANADNVYYFSSRTNKQTTQAAVKGVALTVYTGKQYLVSGNLGAVGQYSDPELIATLPIQATWVMFAIIGGGGGSGGQDMLNNGLVSMGGAGLGGGGLRGVFKLPAGTKKLYGVAGGAGIGGAGLKNNASGGIGGEGATIQQSLALKDGKGGTGGRSGGVGMSGSGGGGGGSTLLAVQLSGSILGVVAVGGGGGGGGGGNTSGGQNAAIGNGLQLQDLSQGQITQLPAHMFNGGDRGATNDGAGGGGGGGGEGVGGSAPAVDGGGNGGFAGKTYYSTALYEGANLWSTGTTPETLNPSGSATNPVIGNRNYYGNGGINGGTGSPGGIRIFYTTAVEKPTDWGLLPELPTPTIGGSPTAFVPYIQFASPGTYSGVDAVSGALRIFGSGLIWATGSGGGYGGSTNTFHNGYALTSNSLPLPTNVIENYSFKLTLLINSNFTSPGVAGGGGYNNGGLIGSIGTGLNVGGSFTYTFGSLKSNTFVFTATPGKNNTSNLTYQGSGGTFYGYQRAQLDIIDPSGAIIHTSYLNWNQ